MRIHVKVCGITTLAEAELAIAAGVDAIGFNGVQPAGPRTISDHVIADITSQLPVSVGTFLLTTERTADGILAQVDSSRVNTVQILHHLSPIESERLANAKSQIRRVQVIHVESPEVIALISLYAAHVDAFLLDSGRPNAGVPELGGTGRIHDWEISAEFVRRSAKPSFLAGGLSADNVGSAIREVRPFGLDLSSGVRTDGRLDARKLAEFMNAVRQSESPASAKAN